MVRSVRSKDGGEMMEKYEIITRCRDCKYRSGDYCHNREGFAHVGNFFFVRQDDFCSRGEKMDEVEE